MNTVTLTIELVTTEPLLGTVPKQKDIYTDYILSKATNDAADELDTLPEEDKGHTGFHEEDGYPILYDYVIKGFMKDACGMLRRDPSSRSKKLTAYRKIIDGMIFVSPRRIPLQLPAGEKLGTLERPLRASTPQGERVALARSDTAPAGTTITFEVAIIGNDITDTVIEWLDYGQLRGLGQWRNAGYGRFTYTIIEA